MNIELTPEPPFEPPVKKSGGHGCLIAIVVVLVLIGAGVFFVVANFRSLAARAISYVIATTIENSDLPVDQKQKLVARIDRLRDDFIAGKITDEQLKRIAEEIVDGPLMPVGMMLFINEKHVAPSGLSEQEKQEARLTLQRVARGLNEKKITTTKLDPAWRVISTTDSKGKRELKKSVTDAELRDFLKLAKKEADDAKIVDAPLDVDLAKELDEAIERAMAEPIEKPF
jgi:hypothetical protein